MELEKQMFTVCKNIEEKYGKEERKILAEERSVRKKMLLKIICLSLTCSKLIGKLSSQIIIEREVCRINSAKAIIVRAALKYGLKTQGKRRSKISNAMFCFTIVFIRMVRTYLLFLLNFVPVYFPFLSTFFSTFAIIVNRTYLSNHKGNVDIIEMFFAFFFHIYQF